MGKRDDDDDFGFRTPTKRSGGESKPKRDTGRRERPSGKAKRATGRAARPDKRDTGRTARPDKRDAGDAARDAGDAAPPAKRDTGRAARPKTGKHKAAAPAAGGSGAAKTVPLVAGLGVAALVGIAAVALLGRETRTPDPIRETARIRVDQPATPAATARPDEAPPQIRPVAPPPRPVRPAAPAPEEEAPDPEAEKDIAALLAELAGRSPTHAEVARILEELNEVFDPAALRDPGPGFERFLERRRKEQELLERIQAMGPIAVDALQEMLMGLDHRQYRLFLGKALAGIEGPEALAAVQAVLGQLKDVSLQTTMIRHLPQTPDAADLVGQAMKGEQDANLRAMLLREYHQRVGDDPTRGAEVFRDAALSDPDPNVRAEAVTILGRRGDPSDQALLEEIISKEDNLSIRQRAIVALGETAKEGALTFLEDLSRDPNASLNVRASAVLAIGKVGGEQAIRSLDLLAQTDPSPEIRTRANRLAQSLRRAQERAASGEDDAVEPGPVQIGPGSAPIEKN